MNPGSAFPLSEVASWSSSMCLDLYRRTIPVLAQAAGGAAADADEAVQNAPANPLLDFLASPINLILISAILFMFIVARPQQKQLKKQQAALSGLKKNDRVVTNAGIHGVVVQASPEEPTVTIRIDENTGARLTINRETIATITPSDSKE